LIRREGKKNSNIGDRGKIHLGCIICKNRNMIPILIWVIRKYLATKVYKIAFPKGKNVKKILTVFFLTIATIFSGSAHFTVKTYMIKRNGLIIGKLSFNQNNDGDNLYLKITSRVNTRFVFKIAIETDDFAHFKNGKLISSNVSRQVNGKEKESRKTNLVNECYRLQSGSTQTGFNKAIAYNMMMLYSIEPMHISQVYSDYFQCFLPIRKKADHHYMVKLPDGNYNEYNFENGERRLITINHPLYTITIELA
jgi:hypothetical protein